MYFSSSSAIGGSGESAGRGRSFVPHADSTIVLPPKSISPAENPSSVDTSSSSILSGSTASSSISSPAVAVSSVSPVVAAACVLTADEVLFPVVEADAAVVAAFVAVFYALTALPEQAAVCAQTALYFVHDPNIPISRKRTGTIAKAPQFLLYID